MSEKSIQPQTGNDIPVNNGVDDQNSQISLPEETKLPLNFKDFIVLIAEDEESSFSYLYELLKFCVKRIDHAYDGKEAVELALKNNYDLILMDIRMPVMNGLEAIVKIKQQLPKVSIIAQTAYAQPEEKEDFLKAGADAYLAKPIFQEDLQKVISQLFNIEFCI